MNDKTRETAEGPQESAAVVNARQRIALIAGSTGTQSPEYATGLNQLALLLIMQGDPDAAEPLLRQALEIRRIALGEGHPDYATNLSSLGGLLWARGDLDRAEPLLRRAVEVRSETFGPGHPKSVVSLKSLEQLLKAKLDRVGTSPAEPANPPARPEPEPRREAPLVPADPAAAVRAEGSERIAAGRERIARDFAGLGEQLTRFGERLLSGSLPLDDGLATAWAKARDAFAGLLQDVASAAAADSVPIPPGGLASLADVAALLPMLREAEVARLAAESRRLDALRILDRVDRLVCPGDPGFESLASCQSRSRALRQTIEASRPGELPDEARGLIGRAHPLSALLDLVEADERTSDAEWADRFDAVVAAFGNPLAVAVARSRISPGGA